MKKILFIFFISLSIVFFEGCYRVVIVEDVKGSKLEDLNTEDNKDNILIIDSRTYAEYKNGHLPNAINIPLSEIDKRTDEFIDWKKKPIYVYAGNDDTSFAACEVLVKNGCELVYNAEGLKQHNYKTVTFDFVRGIVFSRMLEDPNTVIVDCRSKSIYDLGHIKGALSIPMTEITDNLHKLPKNQKLLFYCSVGTGSSRAAAELTKLGYKDVYCSIDGVIEYGFNLTKTGTEK